MDITCEILFTQGSHDAEGLWLELRHWTGGVRDDYVLEWVVRKGPYRPSHSPHYELVGQGIEALNHQLRGRGRGSRAIYLAAKKRDELERQFEEAICGAE